MFLGREEIAKKRIQRIVNGLTTQTHHGKLPLRSNIYQRTHLSVYCMVVCRVVPNVTPKQCSSEMYDYSETMTVSIVMCFKSETEVSGIVG